ncbi:MAG: flagellar biosynthesis protein FliQ [Zetaproteobacteria bacterium]|nr:flagellar biosynthesis protein FliQ [Zetaproteobacteria bacterium]
MNEQTVIDIGTQAAIMSMKVAAPALLTIMVTGFIVSLFQAATQVNEQTLSFIPKIIAMSVALFITGPWILQTMLKFTTDIFAYIPKITE